MQKLQKFYAFVCILIASKLKICMGFGRYVQEGSFVTVIGMLRKDHDALMIVQPPQVISTGCLWQRLLLPVDVDGLILGMPDSTGPVTIPGPIQHPER